MCFEQQGAVMPQRLSRLCRNRLCKATHRNANGYCDAHQVDAQQIKSSRAGKFSKWYTTPRWRSIRSQQLSAEPLCAYCVKAGRVTQATVCDHVEPHRGDELKFWGEPFQSLCQTCHSSTKQREEAAQRGRGIGK